MAKARKLRIFEVCSCLSCPNSYGFKIDSSGNVEGNPHCCGKPLINFPLIPNYCNRIRINRRRAKDFKINSPWQVSDKTIAASILVLMGMFESLEFYEKEERSFYSLHYLNQQWEDPSIAFFIEFESCSEICKEVVRTIMNRQDDLFSKSGKVFIRKLKKVMKNQLGLPLMVRQRVALEIKNLLSI